MHILRKAIQKMVLFCQKKLSLFFGVFFTENYNKNCLFLKIIGPGLCKIVLFFYLFSFCGVGLIFGRGCLQFLGDVIFLFWSIWPIGSICTKVCACFVKKKMLIFLPKMVIFCQKLVIFGQK